MGGSALGQQAQRGDAGEEVRGARGAMSWESRSRKFKRWYWSGTRRLESSAAVVVLSVPIVPEMKWP